MHVPSSNEGVTRAIREQPRDFLDTCSEEMAGNKQLQKRERTGKEYGCFPFVWKTKILNERSTKFESLNQEKKYLKEENGKKVALQTSPKIERLNGSGKQATKL